MKTAYIFPGQGSQFPGMAKDLYPSRKELFEKANEILKDAQDQAREILDNATDEAGAIRQGALDYTNAMLDNLHTIISGTVEDSQNRYTALLSSLSEHLNIIELLRRADEGGFTGGRA